jgi:hypothetical protein
MPMPPGLAADAAGGLEADAAATKPANLIAEPKWLEAAEELGA